MGKRMKSTLPKVLHPIGGEPMLFHILYQLKEVCPQAPIALVVGHGKEAVEAAVKGREEFRSLAMTFVHQTEQKGTGHAARCAMDSAWGEQRVEEKSQVLVLPGDLPLVSQELVRQIVAPLGRQIAMRLLTTELEDPTGYGRIVRRGKKGPVLRIVEEKDANLREKQIREVGTSIYSFQAAFLKFGLSRLSTRNAQGEYYLTDLVAQAARSKKKIEVLLWATPEDLRGVNDPWELAQAGQIFNRRLVKRWSLAGVRFIDPDATWLESQVQFGQDVVVYPGAHLGGKTRVGDGASIGPHVQLRNVEVGSQAQIKAGTVAEDARVGASAMVGPYAHLRPGADVGEGAKIGNFVELKKTRIGKKTSVAHLSYLGDAVVGDRVNIGCGFVTCNYDGIQKHETVIEDDVFMGSDCQTVAPIKVGKGAYVASGSTLTENVESGALAIARSRQVVKPGYAAKLKKG